MTDDEHELLVGILEQTLDGVSEAIEGWPVELRRGPRSGRLLVTAYGAAGNISTNVDLWDLLDWLSCGPKQRRVPGGFSL